MLLFSSCRVVEPVGGDRYFGLPGSPSRVQLLADSTFELALIDPSRDSLLFPGLPQRAFFVNGKWVKQGKDHWLLTPQRQPESVASVDDSISRFTSINSFAFWDKYGAPVNIRSIRFGKSRPKPHYGNSLYFFAQDFYEADTVHFEIIGFEPFVYPGSIPWAIGNNGHKITLTPAGFNYFTRPIRLARKKNKLFFPLSRKGMVQK
ncbi:MAG: hypothetical protein EOO09_03380 [Chitinophagaceae bacterium]|nr:MAG: hypothetical protein EOO09_03380 [Chitinophagaceae bacterium]